MNAEAKDVGHGVMSTDTDSLPTLLATETRPVLVDFWAEWCGPCRALGPIVEALARDYDGKVVVAKVDVDANPELARRFAIRSIPTLIAFVDGAPVETVVGVRAQADYSALLDRLLDG